MYKPIHLLAYLFSFCSTILLRSCSSIIFSYLATSYLVNWHTYRPACLHLGFRPLCHQSLPPFYVLTCVYIIIHVSRWYKSSSPPPETVIVWVSSCRCDVHIIIRSTCNHFPAARNLYRVSVQLKLLKRCLRNIISPPMQVNSRRQKTLLFQSITSCLSSLNPLKQLNHWILQNIISLHMQVIVRRLKTLFSQ